MASVCRYQRRFAGGRDIFEREGLRLRQQRQLAGLFQQVFHQRLLQLRYLRRAQVLQLRCEFFTPR